MSKSSSKRLTSLLFVFVVSVSLVGADLVVLAQNENTQDDTTRGGQMTSNTQTGNMSGNTGTGSRRRRRGRRRSGGNANMSGEVSANVTSDQGNTNATMTGNANMGGAEATANVTGTTGGRRRRRGRRRGGNAGAENTNTGPSVSISPGEPGQTVDISGTFTGTVNYPDYPGGALTGNANLEISSTLDTATGTNFNLTSDTGSTRGRATAVVTRGYIAVTMMFGNDLSAPPAGQTRPAAPAVSLRLRRSGSHITLTSVKGEPHKFSFTSTAAGGTGRVGGRRRRRGRRRGRSTGNMNAGNANTGGGGNMNMSTGNANVQ